MTVAEREAFLAAVHVGVLAVDEPGRGPLALPVWYVLRPGNVVEIGMGRNTLKHRLLEAAGRATLIVQEEALPYRYVSVEGPIAVRDERRDNREHAVRYLGPELGAQYAQANADSDSVLVLLTVEHWRTQDFGKLGLAR